MTDTPHKILVAFDDSPISHKAFDFAIDLAKNYPDGPHTVTVLSVIHVSDMIDVPVDIEPIVASARDEMEAAQQPLKEKVKDLNLNVTTECVMGHPSETIVDYAEKNGYDMIVLGNRGRSKITEWLLGSVSHQVATHTRCTVTIVK